MLKFLLGVMTSITGVSGSGKSSFMYEILYKNLQARYERKYRSAQVFNCSSFSGSEYLSRAILIDQSPIGRTPRSNIATYTGTFTHIRDLFATTEEARLRGWKANSFSFNVKGGRGVKLARVMVRLLLKCISCRLFMSLVMFVMAKDLIKKR